MKGKTGFIIFLSTLALCGVLALAVYYSGLFRGQNGNSSGGGLLIDRLLYEILPMQEYRKDGSTDSIRVRDDPSLYTEDITPLVLYLTVGMDSAGNRDRVSWEELNGHDLSWYSENNEENYLCSALVQIGNETGPVYGAYGFSDTTANATIRLSGIRASTRQQKSYRVELDENRGTIGGMKEFVLQKSFTDPFRMTNKLTFDLLTQIDGILSTRTCFVHLYVQDQTDGQALFRDYGLYTMVEPVNKRYLKNRNLDSGGELYKAVHFDFRRHEDVIMQPTDSRFSQERFEEILEAKGSQDYSGLIELLEAVNDPSVPIQETVARFFDKDSLYRWMAVNILLDNKDTDTENFYLYRPRGDARFHIIPWNFDDILRKDYEKYRDPDYVPGWKQGIFLYNESILFRKIMSSEYCTNELSEYIADLHQSVLSGSNIQKRAEKLSETVLDYLYVKPDRAYARVTPDIYAKLLERISEQVDENYYTYYDTLMTPWPFHIHEPRMTENGELLLSWDESGMIDGNITYTAEVADSWEFEKPILRETGLSGTSLTTEKLPEGQYFLRVRAVADNGYSQEAYEDYYTEKKTVVHGVLCFYIQRGTEP